jgi:hypothetical protein
MTLRNEPAPLSAQDVTCQVVAAVAIPGIDNARMEVIDAASRLLLALVDDKRFSPIALPPSQNVRGQ